MGSFFSSFGPRTVASLTTLPSWTQLGYVVGVTVLTVGGGGLVAYLTDFVHPVHDYNPPWPFPPTKNTNYKKKKLYTNKERCVSLLKPFSAYIFPALLEEILWRGAYVVLLLCCVVLLCSVCYRCSNKYFFKHIDFDYVILVMKYINKNVYCSNMLISSSVILLTVPVSGIPISSSYFLCTNYVCIMLKNRDVVPQSRREYRTLHGCAVGMVARNLSGARPRPSPSGLDVLAPRTDDLSGLSLFTLSDHLFGRGHQFVSSQ